MKIMYVVQSMKIAGAETIATNYLLYLKKENWDVVLLQMFDEATFLNERLVRAGVRVVSALDKKPSNAFETIRQVHHFRRIIRAEKPDVIHVHMGLEKFRFLSYPGGRIVYTLHSELRRALGNGKNHRKMFRKLLKRGMSVIVLNEKAERDIREAYPDIHANVYKIPNGFCFQEIRGQASKREELRTAAGTPQEAFVLGHVGRFHPVKNHEKIMQIFAAVLKKRPDACLWLAGGGTLGEEKRVRALAERNGVISRVKFLGFRRDAVAVMQSFDAFILPSHSEAFPLAAIEAQILGVRTVLSDAVPEEICCNGDCFRLSLDVPAERWAEYILGNFTELRGHSLEDYRIEKVMERHMRLYEKVGGAAYAHFKL